MHLMVVVKMRWLQVHWWMDELVGEMWLVLVIEVECE